MRFDNVPDWLAWQERLHPVSVDLGLARVSLVAKRLGITHPPFPIVSVAGTNGKGSGVALLESIYRQAGYRTGAYTSPHLACYNERVRVAGCETSDEALLAAFEAIDAARADTTLTYFEFGTLAALWVFRQAQVDVGLLEVGLGGRLDAVNLFDADVALVMRIGIDHVDWLGPDRESIGREKAGIFRPGRPAICGDPAPPASIEAHARSLGAVFICAGRDFQHCPYLPGDDGHGAGRLFPSYAVTCASGPWRWEGPGGVRHENLPNPALTGAHQRQNAAAAVMAVECLRERLPVSEGALRQGIAEASLPGRFQLLAGKDGITRILDVAHNPQAAEALAHALRDLPCRGRTLAVVAMLTDKDIAGVLRAMEPVVDAWYAAGIDAPRGAGAGEMAAILSRIATGAVHRDATVADAYRAALQAAMPGDRVVVFGSFYTVGMVLRSEEIGVLCSRNSF
uniref:Dihydrofolate synthase/folylpolyglutamate synthase n=1 Tax=Candidatus Kentrum sp. DK TaxID=2126562 RepID=A0A450S701_9GAMM|nr:MAG: dihydrofolate synthase / folylpolyglutamate synthase [Candidatus Kentron sp. DK]